MNKENEGDRSQKPSAGLSAVSPHRNAEDAASIPVAPALKTYINATAQIDFCYFVLGEWAKSSEPPKHSVIIAMVDAATGKDKAAAKELRKGTLSLLNCIIRNKKRIGADYSGDVKCRDQIKAFKP